MVDTLYPAGAQLLEGASQTAGQIGQQNVEKQKTATEAQVQTDKQFVDLANSELDRRANMITITPQLALGLVKNTGDKEWMKAVNSKMRVDMYTALYTHGIETRITGKEFDVLHDGKQYRMINTMSPEGEVIPKILAIGDAPVSKTGVDTPKAEADRISREKIAAEKLKAAKSGSTKEDPKNKEFEKTYRGYLKDTEGMNYMLTDQMAKKDPKQASDLKMKLDFIQQNQKRFNDLQGTSSVPRGTSSPDGEGGGDVITIKDSQGQTHQIYKQNLDAAKKRDPGVTVVQ